MPDLLHRIIKTALTDELDKDIAEAIERFNERKAGIVANIVVEIHKQADMRILEDRVVFELRDVSEKSNPSNQ